MENDLINISIYLMLNTDDIAYHLIGESNIITLLYMSYFIMVIIKHALLIKNRKFANIPL